MLRYLTIVLAAASLAAIGPGYASASSYTFADISAMAPLSYYNAIPEGINTSGVVTMQGYSATYHSTNAFYHVYLYTGGTAGTLTDLTSGFTSITTADALNGNGQMTVGGVGGGNGYFYSGGTVTTFKYATSSTLSLSINQNGDVGGYCSSSPMNPFVYTGGTAYTFNLPAADSSYGGGILGLNTSGQAVGFVEPGGGIGLPGLDGAVWTYTISGGSVAAQTATDIGSLVQGQYSAAQSSDLLAINSSGKAVGSWSTSYSSSMTLSGVSGSFIYNVGTPGFTSLGSLLVGSPFPGSLSHEAGESQAINDSGVVVGCIVNTANSSGYDAAIWQSGTVTDLNTLYAGILPSGFVLDNATAIDENGDIAGYGHDANGHTDQAWVIYAPVPEPVHAGADRCRPGRPAGLRMAEAQINKTEQGAVTCPLPLGKRGAVPGRCPATVASLICHFFTRSQKEIVSCCVMAWPHSVWPL